MPRSATTGVFSRVSNSFSNPVFGTLIDPTDAIAYFNDLDVGLNPPQLDGPVRIIDALQVGTTGTAAGTVEFFNATSGSITVSPPAGALGSVTMTLPAATDTFVGKATTDTLTNKTFDTAGTGNSFSINGVAVTANTGTGAVARATSPTFVTPILGVATATTYNKVTITAPATAATLTLIDGTTLTGPAASGTAMTLGNTETVTGVKTFGAAGNVGKLAVAGTTSGSTILNATAVASGTLTLPAETATLITGATTATFTNKTFNSTGTGNTLQVSGVTVSAGQYPGEPTTGSATAGNVGEYVEANLALGSAISLTTSTAVNITSISLSAGDWDVSGITVFVSASTTVRNLFISSLSTTSGALATAVLAIGRSQLGSAMTGSTEWYEICGPTRFSLSGTTTVFLVSRADFTTSTMTAYGSLRARRVR